MVLRTLESAEIMRSGLAGGWWGGGGGAFIQTSSWKGSLSETQPVKSLFFISLQKAEQVR